MTLSSRESPIGASPKPGAASAAPPAVRARGALASGCAAHFVHDGLSDSIYVLLPLWAEAFGLNHAQVGLLKTAFSGAMASSQLPMGLIAERIGERTLLAAGTVAAGAFFALICLAGGYAVLLVLLMAAGLATGVQHPLASAIISRAYAAGGRRAALGIYNFSGDIGKVAIPFMIALAAAAVGWQAGVLIYGIVMGAVAAAVYAALTRTGAGARPPQERKTARAERMAARRPGWGLTNVAGYSALSAVHIIDSITRYSFLTFLPFLLIGKGAAVSAVGFALALVFAGGAAGKLACGLLAERMGLMRTVVATELASAALIAAIVFLPLTAALAVLPLLGVALNGTSSVIYGTVGEFAADDRQARAFGLFYTLGVGAGAVSPFLIGLLSDATSVEAALLAVAVLVLAVLPFCLVLRRHLAA